MAIMEAAVPKRGLWHNLRIRDLYNDGVAATEHFTVWARNRKMRTALVSYRSSHLSQLSGQGRALGPVKVLRVACCMGCCAIFCSPH